MHPMHMALEASDYATIRSGMPKLAEASKGVGAYKCPSSEKCSPDCLKKFEEKKSVFMKSVDELNAACKGEDNGKVDATFGVMHEAYVGFASMCAHPKTTEATEKTEPRSKHRFHLILEASAPRGRFFYGRFARQASHLSPEHHREESRFSTGTMWPRTRLRSLGRGKRPPCIKPGMFTGWHASSSLGRKSMLLYIRENRSMSVPCPYN